MLSSNKIRLSVLLVTRNRHLQLLDCLTHLCAMNGINNFKTEVIVVDESQAVSKEWVEKYKAFGKKVAYHWQPNLQGKSAGINYAASIARGNIFLLTDDDCIVDSEWALELGRMFEASPTLGMVFGKTKPYEKTRKKDLICPSLFDRPIQTDGPIMPHWLSIGVGNNMAVRKDVFERLGGFADWLGPGTPMKSGEDGEFILRGQIKNVTMQFCPQALVHHNKWISKSSHDLLIYDYILGGVAGYAYHALRGVDGCWRICRLHLTASWQAYLRPPFEQGHWGDFGLGMTIFVSHLVRFVAGVGVAVWKRFN